MSDNVHGDHGVRIDVIDGDTKHDNGFLARERLLHPAYINCHDVRSMVHNVLIKAQGKKSRC